MKRSGALWLALSTALAVLAGAFWQWVLIDWLPFLFWLCELAAVIVLIVSGTASTLRAVRSYRESRGLDLGPLAVNVITVALLYFVPFTSLWLDADYRLNRAARIRVVEQVNSGALRPNVSYSPSLISLPETFSTVSRGGNQVVVHSSENGHYVLFFTYRGILGHSSGFLYVPPGGSPEAFGKSNGRELIEVTQVEPQWFFVAST